MTEPRELTITDVYKLLVEQQQSIDELVAQVEEIIEKLSNMSRGGRDYDYEE